MALEELYNSDLPITHFPAGEVSRVYSGKVQDKSWQKSFITKAVSYKHDIVPFYFYGNNSRFFYFVFRLRRFLRINANFELILLLRELFKKKNKTISLVIGKPISWQCFDTTISHYEWAQKVRDHFYRVGLSKEELIFQSNK